MEYPDERISCEVRGFKGCGFQGKDGKCASPCVLAERKRIQAPTPPPSGTGEDVANLKKQLMQIEGREAACCPEDVPFDEYIRVLEKKLACFSQGNPGQKEETKPMLTELEDAADIIRKMYSTEPCEFDHHGYCQTHGWMSAVPCPHQRAKEYLKKYPEKPAWQGNSLDIHQDGGDDGF